MKTIKVISDGKKYVVDFDDDNKAVSVRVVVKRGRDYGSHEREIWHRRTGQGSPAATLATFAALAVLKKEAQQ